MSRWGWGLAYWGLIWFGLAFLPAELWGNTGLAPWPTLSATIQHYVHEHWVVSAVVFAVMLGLSVHFLFDQKLWKSLLFGTVIALSAHMFDNKWP